MKKRTPVIIVFLLATLILLPTITAQTPDNLPTTDCPAGDTSCVLAQQFGLNKSLIPEKPEDIKQLYLKMRWTDFMEKNRILGPIHKFFSDNTWFFYLFFHYAYEFSLTFFLIIFLWIFFAGQIGNIAQSLTKMKTAYAFPVGILGSIVLSWIPPNSAGIIEMIATLILDLIFKQENWWMRLIIIISVMIVIAIMHKTVKYAERYIKEQNKKKLEERQERGVKKIEKLEQGAGIQ